MADDKKRNEPGRKVESDAQGRSVWTETVRTGKFELVTTQELRAILDSSDDDSRRSIEAAAATEDEGVLARDAETGVFQIVDETSLQSILGGDDATTPLADAALEPVDDDDGGGLSLVSTQALRRIIRQAPAADGDDDGFDPEIIDTGGFDPYNSS